MKISSLPEGDICDVRFGYNSKMEGYTTLMSYIPKLYEKCCHFGKESVRLVNLRTQKNRKKVRRSNRICDNPYNPSV
jgi:hypothetical protein